MEEKLRYSATLLKNVSEAVISHDLNFKIVSWNGAAQKIYGWKAEEVIGRSMGEVFQTEQSDIKREEMLANIRDKGIWLGEVTQIRKDGKRIYIQINVSRILNDHGNAVGYVGVARDITALKLAEEALHHAKINYRIVADYTYDWEWWESTNGTFYYVSPACERITGYKADQFIENHSLLREIIVPEDRDKWDKHYNKTHKDGDLQEMQFRIKRQDGGIRWIEHACQQVFTRENNRLSCQ
jgi:sigma-B regulation protein RsbU (phosphoserine phosphatase)